MQSDLEFTPTFEEESLPILVPKEFLPKIEPVKLPKEEIKAPSTIKMQFKDRGEFVDYFTNGYLQLGVKNPDIAKAMAVQDLLESLTKDGQGFSRLATEYNNFGGIKYTGRDPNKGVGFQTDEYINGKRTTLDKNNPGAQFRKFNSPQEYMSYKLNMMRNGNFKGALDGDINHYLSILMGNNPGGKKYATAPHYADYLRNMISKYKIGGVLKAKNGIPLRNEYSTPGEWYDYSGSDYIPSGDGHWPSRNPKTGLLLKNPNHDTYYKMLKSEKKLGHKLYEDAHGREYSFNELERMTKGFAPGFKEKPYPNDLFTRDAKVLYGPKLSLAKRYYNKLKSLGAGDVQAAAMVGVFMQESSLDHFKISSNNAKGIAQLLGSKYDDYKLWLSKTGKSDTADSQIEWVWDHMSFGKDHWHDYYMSLLRHSLNDFADYKNSNDRDKYRSDWAKMKDSKFAEYNYEAFRDDFYNMSDPGDAAELFTWTFERPGEDEANIDQRRLYANAIYEYMTN